jgi:hypothetical protein
VVPHKCAKVYLRRCFEVSCHPSYLVAISFEPAAGAVTVRAAVLTDGESERCVGASLADQGIQVLWLSVASDIPLRLRPIVTDLIFRFKVERLLRRWWRGGTSCAMGYQVLLPKKPNPKFGCWATRIGAGRMLAILRLRGVCDLG